MHFSRWLLFLAVVSPIAARPTDSLERGYVSETFLDLRDAIDELKIARQALTRLGDRQTPDRPDLLRNQIKALVAYDMAVDRFIADKNNKPADRMRYALECFKYASKTAKSQREMVEKLKANPGTTDMEETQKDSGAFTENFRVKEFSVDWYAEQMREICREDSNIEGCAGLEKTLSNELVEVSVG